VRSSQRWVIAVAVGVLVTVAGGCDRAPEQPALSSPSVSVQPSESPSESPSPAPPPCTTAAKLASWSLERLALQTLTVPVQETSVSAVSAQVAAGTGGVILFGSQAPASIGSSLATLTAKAPDGIAPFVMSDEEGGTVQRMPNIVGRIPSARTMARTMTTAQIHDLALHMGQKLKAAGVTMDLAPVLDLDDRAGPSAANPDGTRSFSLDPKKASAAGLAFMNGLRDAGVVPVVKHFPGLGYSTANSDNAEAKTRAWPDLQKRDLLPFQDAISADVPAVMIANASVPGLTTLPASLSPEAITTVLRQQMHYDGLIVTDSLSATAIKVAGYSVPKAVVQSLRAGADLVIYTLEVGNVSTATRQTTDAIVAAVNAGTLSRDRLEDAVTHILAAKKVDLCKTQ
jgi:beta-N-acetylhexosaminidase